MECEEVLTRLWEYLDQELGPEESHAVGAHVGICPRCHPRYRCDLAFLALVARQRARCSAPRLLLDTIRARLRVG